MSANEAGGGASAAAVFVAAAAARQGPECLPLRVPTVWLQGLACGSGGDRRREPRSHGLCIAQALAEAPVLR